MLLLHDVLHTRSVLRRSLDSKPAQLAKWACHSQEFDSFEGYGPAVDRSAGDITLGDLVEVDDGRRVVVDAEPDAHLGDPDCMAIPWRDDADDEGILLLGNGEQVGGSEQPSFTIPGMGGAGLDQTRLIVVGGLLMSLLICTGALIRRRWIEWRSVQ